MIDSNGKLVLGGVAVLAVLACGVLQPAAPPSDGMPTAALQGEPGSATAASTAASSPGQPAGATVSFPGGSLVVPPGLATGVVAEEIAAVQPDESQPWWNVAPAHVRLTLQGYALQGKFHEPQIVIYPAEEFAAMNESVANNFQDLRGLIANPAGANVPGSIPGVPFFNAGAIMNAQTALLDFPGGQGIRVVTQYSQFYAQVNNAELFYHFQGLTADGKTYVLAILPLTAPLLAPDGAETSQPPVGGVAFPGYQTYDEAAIIAYYRSVTDMLNVTSPNQFHPSLSALDALVQSLEVSP